MSHRKTCIPLLSRTCTADRQFGRPCTACLANASMALALSAHTPWCNPVSHVSACWLTGLGLGTPSRYLARIISWNACKILSIIMHSLSTNSGSETATIAGLEADAAPPVQSCACPEGSYAAHALCRQQHQQLPQHRRPTKYQPQLLPN